MIYTYEPTYDKYGNMQLVETVSSTTTLEAITFKDELVITKGNFEDAALYGSIQINSCCNFTIDTALTQIQ